MRLSLVCIATQTAVYNVLKGFQDFGILYFSIWILDFAYFNDKKPTTNYFPKNKLVPATETEIFQRNVVAVILYEVIRVRRSDPKHLGSV